MSAPRDYPEPQLERQARRLLRPGSVFLVLAAVLIAPGLLLFTLTSGWTSAFGIALAALGVPALWIAIGSLASALVAHWAAQRKPFA